jgi:hypothetical protein
MQPMTAEQLVMLSRIFVEKGISVQQAQRLRTSGLLSDLCDANLGLIDRNEFRSLCKLTPFKFEIVVDYDKNFTEMLAAGKYDSWNALFTKEHFPITGHGQKKLNARIFDFDRDMGRKEVLTKIDRAGFQPATIEELLAFGAIYPEVQLMNSIIALGSVPQDCDDFLFPCLSGGSQKRELLIVPGRAGFAKVWKFLGVSK